MVLGCARSQSLYLSSCLEVQYVSWVGVSAPQERMAMTWICVVAVLDTTDEFEAGTW